MWKLRYRHFWLPWRLWALHRESKHGTLGGAKQAACNLHTGKLERNRFEIYDPAGKLHLTSGPGNGWRLKWKKAE